MIVISMKNKKLNLPLKNNFVPLMELLVTSGYKKRGLGIDRNR